MKRILIVDDEVEVLRILRTFFTKAGYEAHTAQDGFSALKQVMKVKPHVVLLDIVMPGIDGIEVLQTIREMDPRIGIIMATAVWDEDLAKKAIRLGAFEYITKPYNLIYLEEVISKSNRGPGMTF